VPIEKPLVEVIDLKIYFPVLAGVLRRKVAEVKAVDGLSFHIEKGETLGLVGESGCGKTTTGRGILQLHKIRSGKVLFEGWDLCAMKGDALRRMRRHMQPIFQDPFASLDPRMSAGRIVGEPLIHHNLSGNRDELREKVEELFRMVELDPMLMERYPHEFSGGQRQRIGIARALALRPSLIICDEAVSALDVSIQAQIIDLLERLREEFKLTYLFIAHDLSVVRHISDRVAVMYLGRLVEITSSDELYENPVHPYTQGLLSAIPIPDPIADRKRERILLKGDVPSPINLPQGCSFHPRCHRAMNICQTRPELKDIGDNHLVACHLV
jgi:oligopeptide transport system ATP-binding protein